MDYPLKLTGWFVLLCLLLWATASGKVFYVAPTGTGPGIGTAEEPFVSLEQARDAVRLALARGRYPSGGITVYLLGGSHVRERSFELGPQDSGTAECPVVYRSFPGQRARLIGGRRLESQWFRRVTPDDPLWKQIPKAARESVWACPLPEHGIRDYGVLRSRGFGRVERAPLELSYDGQMMPLARWPNQGFARIHSAIDNTTFEYSGDRPQRWTQAADPWAFGYWKYGWADRYEAIAAIDTAQRRISLAQEPGYGIAENRLWYVLNMIEELDRAGEWYLDRDTGTLYFWPLDQEFSEHAIWISLLGEDKDPLLRLDKTAWIRFTDVDLTLCRFEAVRVTDSEQIHFSGCSISNTGTSGIEFSGCLNSGIAHSELKNLGGRGIGLQGGDRASLSPSGLYVRHNHIHQFGRWLRTYAPAVSMSGVGHRVIHNRIHDAPHAAILYGGNDHEIAYNDISHVCYDSDDAAAVYSGRDWGSRGHRLEYNWIHHLDVRADHPTHHGVHGIYLDDCDSGDTIFGNVFYRVSGAAVFLGGGRDNHVLNNVMAKCGWAIHADRRGVTWKDKVNNRPGDSWNLLEKIQRYNYTRPPWSTAYPKLAAIFAEDQRSPGFDLNNPRTYPQAREPKGCIVSQNIGWQNDRWEHGDGFRYFIRRYNYEDRDPRFINEQELDLRLAPDSPAWDLPGFQAIPFDQIGIVGTQ